MTALSANSARKSKLASTKMIVKYPVSASAVIYAGSGMVLNAGYAEPATTATGLISVGRALDAVTGGAGDGDVSVEVEQGIIGPFATGTSGDEITAASLGLACYWADDNTVHLTDGGAPTKSFAGYVADVTADGIFILCGLQVRESGVSDFQSGTVTLASGTASVSSGITVSANSHIIATWEDAAADITFAATGGELAIVSKTAGSPGTGAFTVNTVTGGGAIDATGAGVVRYTIIG